MVVLLAIGGGGSYFGYLKFYHEGSPRADARAAIILAEESLHKAGPIVKQDETTDLKQAAQRLLAEARRQYDAANYLDSRKAAVESHLNAEKAIALSRGESAREVQFYRVEGDVKVKRVRELIWIDADEGMSLSIGDQVKTSSRASAQIIYFNGTITTIKPGSLLEIKDLYDNPATKVQQVKERLREGRIAASTQEGAAGSYHEVSTDNSVATSTKRADFEVAYDKDASRTQVSVLSGQAKLSSSGGSHVELGTAETAEVDARAKVSDVARLRPSPIMQEPPDQKIFLIKGSEVPPVDLMWRPVPDAARYRLQITSKPLFAEPEVDLSSVSSTSATLPNLSEGGYFWRVAAIFNDGTEGPFTSPRRFKVMPARVAQAGDTEPPQLTIEDFLVFSTQIIIRGRTEPGTLLTIAGEKVDVYDDGSFTTVVALTRVGVNKVTFIAQDMAGNENRLDRTAHVDGY